MRGPSPKPASGWMRRAPVVGSLAILAALLAAACGASSIRALSQAHRAQRRRARLRHAPSSSGKSLTLGTKDFTEEFIVGQLYRQALEANGCAINYEQNIGATEIVDRALTSGQIDAYPEYTGEAVATVAKITKTVSSPREEYLPRQGVLRQARPGDEQHDAVL